MSFQKVGPYRLTRADLVAASVVISFIIGSKKTRIWAMLCLLLGTILIGGGLVAGEFTTSALGFFLIIYIFVAIPALRYNKTSKDIYLTYSEQGLVADTGDMATTYRWITIGKFKRVGSRLFIMINNGCALVISERTTSSENIEKIISTITQS
jgi:hypothetical protein